MKEALYIDNAFWQSKGTEGLRETLTEAALRQGITLAHRTNADFLKEGSFSRLPPAALFWDKDQRLAASLEAAGLRLFNPQEAIRLCDDKTLTYLHLKHQGIPMPDTLLCPFTFGNVGYTRMDFVEDAALRLGLPFVIKAGCGSFGAQVFLAHTVEEAAQRTRTLAGEPVLFQRFIKESAGRDLRLYVVGGKVIAAMERVNLAGDFRANIAIGGSANRHEASEEESAIALSACEKLGLDFGGVDLLQSKDGPLLCEVNSNAHFAALTELCGINPADHIIALLKEALA